MAATDVRLRSVCVCPVTDNVRCYSTYSLPLACRTCLRWSHCWLLSFAALPFEIHICGDDSQDDKYYPDDNVSGRTHYTPPCENLLSPAHSISGSHTGCTPAYEPGRKRGHCLCCPRGRSTSTGLALHIRKSSCGCHSSLLASRKVITCVIILRDGSTALADGRACIPCIGAAGVEVISSRLQRRLSLSLPARHTWPGRLSSVRQSWPG